MILATRKIELWDFQARGLDGLRANIRQAMREDRHVNQVLCFPCGGGKTETAMSMVQEALEKGNRSLFVCDRTSLVRQTSQRYDKYGIPHGVIMADHPRRRPWELAQVASAQTLERRDDWPPASLVIVDECHTLRRAILKRIRARDTTVVGLSATPFSRGMGKHYDAVVSAATTNALISSGRLVPFRVYAPSEPDMTGAKTTAGEWRIDEAEKRSLPIIGDAVREYLRHGEDSKFIAFGVTIAHCEELQRQFMAAGIQCATYCANTPDAERDQAIEEFRKPDSYIKGLVSVAALSRGFDVPDVSCIIMCRPLRKSLAEHIQILGRGLRSHPGKEYCTILDHSSNMVRFWGPMQDFFENGVDELDDGRPKPRQQATQEERQPAKCPQCHHVHPPRPHCPMCGHEYPRRRNQVRHVDGRLRELVGSGVSDGEERQALYSGLIAIAQERSRKIGWAKHSYHERVGAWPNGLADVPADPTQALRRWVKSRDIAFAKGRKRRAA